MLDRVGPNSIGLISLKEIEIWTQMSTQGEGCVTMKAKTRMLHLQAKAHQRWLANHQELGETWNRYSIMDLRRSHPCWHLDL